VRIALHMGTLRGLGSASVGQNILLELARQGEAHAFEAWIPEEWPDAAVAGLERTQAHRVRAGVRAKFVDENLRIRRSIRRGQADRLFSLGDTSLPLPGLPHLLMVQQAYLAYERGDWGFRPPAPARAKMRLMATYFRAGLTGATRLTVQTQDMKAHLMARWGLGSERVAVVPSALGASWQRIAEGPDRSEPVGPPTLCYPAGPAPHKNHRVLIPMLRALAARVPDVRLRLTISRQALPALAEEARAAGVLDRIEFLGGVAGAALPALLAASTVVVVPSLLESFGLTYYEAMAAGTPIVASDRGFAREALGDAGHYGSPQDGEALAAAALRLIGAGSAWCDASRAVRTRYLAKRRTWPDVAAEYLRILEGLA